MEPQQPAPKQRPEADEDVQEFLAELKAGLQGKSSQDADEKRRLSIDHWRRRLGHLFFLVGVAMPTWTLYRVTRFADALLLMGCHCTDKQPEPVCVTPAAHELWQVWLLVGGPVVAAIGLAAVLFAAGSKLHLPLDVISGIESEKAKRSPPSSTHGGNSINFKLPLPKALSGDDP